ncbi:MAG: hypothetical protein HY687_06615 [Chloroflexi bacterium]|nr:hypothetical protein [Chloroflexota bacterium]
MTKVFFGGSRRLSRFNAEIRARIDNVLLKGFGVLIGDANGADKAVQKYLAEKRYPDVRVFCAGVTCRNNLGDWNVESVSSDRNRADFLHYAKRDARMADQADYGFFLWDGKSKGTLNNIVMLLKQEKPALVYVSPRKEFIIVKHMDDLKALLSKCEPQTIKTLRSVVQINEKTVVRQSRLDLA